MTSNWRRLLPKEVFSIPTDGDMRKPVRLFNPPQLECVRHCILLGALARTNAHERFEGVHDGKTVRSLLDQNILVEVKTSQSGYPMEVRPNRNHSLIHNFQLLGKSVSLALYPNSKFTTVVLGFGMKGDELVIRYNAGSFYHAPISAVVGTVE